MTRSTIVLVAFVLGACTPSAMPRPNAHFGEAVAHNIAVQTVNPDAPLDKRPIAYDAAHQALAQGRYESDKVKQPTELSTSRVGLIGVSGGSN